MKIRAALLLALLLGAAPCFASEDLRLGVTFSAKQCRYLNLEWRRVYRELLTEEWDLVRLGAYWDEIEAEPGTYDFTDLDWQLEEAWRRGIPVLLTVGMKAPRWPEFHIPLWLMRELRLRRGSDLSQNELLRLYTLAYVEQVVERYKDHPAVAYWQLENEPLDRSGPGLHWIGPDLLREEAAILRAHDERHRPVVVNFATFPNRFLRLLRWFFTRHDPVGEGIELADIVALNVYPAIGHRWWFKHTYYWSSPSQRRAHLVPIVKRAEESGKPVWLTELQAEPWEPGELVYTGIDDPPTSRPAMLAPYIQEMRDLGIDTVILWGAEYWYYRERRKNDTAWSRAVSALLDMRTRNVRWDREERD